MMGLVTKRLTQTQPQPDIESKNETMSIFFCGTRSKLPRNSFGLVTRLEWVMNTPTTGLAHISLAVT